MPAWRDQLGSVLRPDDVGREVTLAGWVARRRDHGGLVFVDLRDEGGVVQVVINPENSAEAAAVAHELRNEFVSVRAAPVSRTPETVNPAMATGEIEVQAFEVEIVSRSTPLPFSSTRRASTTTCACATAGSTCAARSCSGTSVCAGRWSGRSAR